MNKLFTKIATAFVGMAMAVGVGVAINSASEPIEVKADEQTAYTLSGMTATGTNTGPHNSYYQTASTTQGTVSWNVTANSYATPWKIGGKKTDLSEAGVVRKIQSTTAVSTRNITKVVISTAKPASDYINVTDITLKVGSSAGDSTDGNLSNGSWQSSVTFNRPAGKDWSNKYFEIGFVMPANTTNTNKYITFSSATFYYDDSEVAPKSISVTTSATIDYGSNTKTASLSATKNNGASGTVTWTIESGSQYVSLPAQNTGDSIVVTGTAVGDAVIKAVCSDCDEPAYSTIHVVDVEHAGTRADPLSVADALLIANRAGSDDPSVNYYVHGYIINKTYYSTSHTANFDLGDTANATDKLNCYKTYGDANKTGFNDTLANSIIANGNQITVFGSPFMYNGTKAEISEGYAYSKSPSSLASTAVSGSFNAGDNPSISDLGITLTVTYDDGTTADVTSEAVITAGVPLTKGSNNLTISYSEDHAHTGIEKSASCNVTVSDVVQQVTSVNITSSVSTVNVNETITLTAEALPADANNKTLTWSSSNADVASVDSSTGVVTGVAAGSATITATSNNNKTASVSVLVKDPTDIPTDLVLSGELTKSAYYVGEAFNPSGLVATLKMAKSADVVVTGSVTWSPSILNTAGEAIEVTGSYTLEGVTVTDTVEVRVVERTVSSIAVTTAPAKDEYVIGIDDTSSLDLSGLVVTATYVLGDTADVTNSVSVGEVDLSSAGVKTVSVSFGGKSTSFEVTVRQAICPLTVGKQYVLAAYDKKNDDYYELTSISTTSTKYGVGTEYNTEGKTNYPLANDMVLTAEQGVVDNSVAFKTSNNKYLTWLSGKSLNVSDEKDADGHSSWTITYETSELTGIEYAIISNVNSSDRKIWWNVSSPRFAAYDGDKTYETDSYGGVMLYTYEYCKIGNFVDAYMHPEIETTDTGSSSNYQTCKGTGYYDVAKPAFNALPLSVRQEFAKTTFEFYPYYQRLLAWAAANGDVLNSSNELAQGSHINPLTNVADSTVTIAIVVISAFSVLAIGGYFFLRKKKVQ